MKHYHVIVLEPYTMGGSEIRAHMRKESYEDAEKIQTNYRRVYAHPVYEHRLLVCSNHSCHWEGY